MGGSKILGKGLPMMTFEELEKVSASLDRIAGSGQRSSAQRQPIHALAAILQAVGIALEHLEICHQVMRKGDRLGDLQMGESRHDGVRVL